MRYFSLILCSFFSVAALLVNCAETEVVGTPPTEATAQPPVTSPAEEDDEEEQPDETGATKKPAVGSTGSLAIQVSDLPHITDPVLAFNDSQAAVTSTSAAIEQQKSAANLFNTLQISTPTALNLVGAATGISMANTAAAHNTAFQAAANPSQLACEMTIQSHLRLFDGAGADSMQCFITQALKDQTDLMDGKDHIVTLSLFDDETNQDMEVPAKINLKVVDNRLVGFNFWACRGGNQAFYTKIDFSGDAVVMESITRRPESNNNGANLRLTSECESGEPYDSDGDGYDDSCSNGSISCEAGSIPVDTDGDGNDDQCTSQESEEGSSQGGGAKVGWTKMNLNSAVDDHQKLVGLKVIEITTYKDDGEPLEWGKITIKQSDRYIEFSGWNANTNGNDVDKDFDEFRYFSELLDSSTSLADAALKNLALGDGAGRIRRKRHTSVVEKTEGWLGDSLSIETEDEAVQAIKERVREDLPSSKLTAHTVSFAGVQAWDCSGESERTVTLAAEAGNKCDSKFFIDQEMTELDCASL